MRNIAAWQSAFNPGELKPFCCSFSKMTKPDFMSALSHPENSFCVRFASSLFISNVNKKLLRDVKSLWVNKTFLKRALKAFMLCFFFSFDTFFCSAVGSAHCRLCLLLLRHPIFTKRSDETHMWADFTVSLWAITVSKFSVRNSWVGKNASTADDLNLSQDFSVLKPLRFFACFYNI